MDVWDNFFIFSVLWRLLLLCFIILFLSNNTLRWLFSFYERVIVKNRTGDIFFGSTHGGRIAGSDVWTSNLFDFGIPYNILLYTYFGKTILQCARRGRPTSPVHRVCFIQLNSDRPMRFPPHCFIPVKKNLFDRGRNKLLAYFWCAVIIKQNQ